MCIILGFSIRNLIYFDLFDEMNERIRLLFMGLNGNIVLFILVMKIEVLMIVLMCFS